MNKILKAIITYSVIAVASISAHAGDSEAINKNTIATQPVARVIVKFKATSNMMRALAVAPNNHPQHARGMSARLGMNLKDGRALAADTQVFTAEGMTSQELADRLAAQPDVEYAVVSGRMHVQANPNDPEFTDAITGQWYLRQPSVAISSVFSVTSSINSPAAWDITIGNPSVVVAVLDTGVRFDHPDLVNKLLPGYDFVARDARGTDASDPGDWVTQNDLTNDPFCHKQMISNSSWHGTKVAGLIGASINNKIGIAGAGGNVKLLPVRVLGRCGGADEDILAGMLWAGGIDVPGIPKNPNPAKIINMSLGSPNLTCSQSFVDTVRRLYDMGVVMVSAAGNDGLVANQPANCPGVMSVGGLSGSL
jgi:serine protease